MRVVTYQACGGDGARINICPDCERALKIAQLWPRHPSRGEYGQAIHGLHHGSCDLCHHTANVAPSSVLGSMVLAGLDVPRKIDGFTCGSDAEGNL